MTHDHVHSSSARQVLGRVCETIEEYLEAESDPWRIHDPDAGDDDLPLVDSAGVVIGRLDRPQELDHLDPKARDVVGTLIAAYEFVLQAESARRQALEQVERIEQEAYSDCLTALPNRRAWERALEREQARCDRQDSTRVAVVVVDVDGLKRTNDEHGHLAGDLLLRQTATALAGAFRATDVVARIGGDEFAVLAVDYEDATPKVLVDRVRAALDDTGVEASVGVAVHEPGRRLVEVVARADAAMYEQKRRPTRRLPEARTVQA